MASKAGNWRNEGIPLLLTLVGGSVDAMVILGFNVLTAAQTGNTVLLAVAIARGDLVTGASAATSVIAFVVGCILGACMLGCRKHQQYREPSILPVLLLEVVLLSALLLIWHGAEPVSGYRTLLVVAVAAFTMGLQSAAVLHAGGPATTYMTGMLATFSTGFASWINSVTTAHARETDDGHDRSDRAQTRAPFPWRNGVGWLVYLGGAILCGTLFLRFGAMALLMPLGISLVLVGLLVRRPSRPA